MRRGRERFWGKGMAGDKEAAFATLYHVLETLYRLIAPFVPFMAESMYQNLVLSTRDDMPESVHLTDFPVCDEKYIKPGMEEQMDALIKAVQLGRACRSAANLKVRQPLTALYVKGAAFSEEYAAQARDELNVKSVEFITSDASLTDYRLKPQMRTLGPRYGKLLGKIGQALNGMNGTEVVALFSRGEKLTFDVDGHEIVLDKDDVLTEPVQKEGLVSQSQGDLTVALDTRLTDDLIREGFAREVISKLQTMRKDLGFEVTDRISVRVACGEKLAGALRAYEDMIKASVLAVEMALDGAEAGEGSQEWSINGEKAVLTVAKV